MALKRRTVAGCLLALLAGCLLHGQALGKSSVQCHAPPPALVQKLPPANADSKRTHCCSLSARLMPSLQLLRASQNLVLRRLADGVPVLASAFSDGAMHEPSCPAKNSLLHCPFHKPRVPPTEPLLLCMASLHGQRAPDQRLQLCLRDALLLLEPLPESFCLQACAFKPVLQASASFQLWLVILCLRPVQGPPSPALAQQQSQAQPQ